MGRRVFTNTAHQSVKDRATDGGAKSATSGAEEQHRKTMTLDTLVDPKGLAHLGLGPIRLSLPRFEQQENGLWMLTIGVPMPVELLLDTTGSMGDNVDMALEVLPKTYELLASDPDAVLRRYDPQIANGVFGDVEDERRTPGSPVLCRSQFEMDVEISRQLTLMVPSRNGCGNGKEDPQFGLFAAAYFTRARINQYGLLGYHFTVSDEPVAIRPDIGWLKRIFGDDFLEYTGQNDFPMTAREVPDTRQVIHDLQKRAHAFFLQVGERLDVTRQWRELYGKDRCIMLPDGTKSLHLVQAAIIGLTEGVLSLSDVKDYMCKHGAQSHTATTIARAISGIPIGAQAALPNFNRLPKAGDLFREKTDLWPLTPEELAELSPQESGDENPEGAGGGVDWL